MRSTKKYLLLAALITVVGLWSCKKWDDHIEPGQQALNINLMQEISSLPNLSKFAEYLAKTGLDKEISSSKTYTVFAPDNDALATLSPDVIADTAKLKAYLLNHIAGQLYFKRMAKDSIRITMMNGKKIYFYNSQFDDATISQGDVYVKNGVLHVINKVIAPLPNLWEYISSTTGTYNQNAYISSLVYQSQDPQLAELDSINPVTGDPVYKPNTGIIQINTFRTKVYDVANEDSLYTYILLVNSAFAGEVDKQKIYFTGAADDTITNNASWNVVKDFAIKGLYKRNALPATLRSKFNVNVPMKPSAILETVKVSNGIVYIMNEAAVAKEEKVPTVIIQGENPSDFSSTADKYITKIFYRQRFNSLTGQPFNDIYANLGSSGNNYYIEYNTNDLYTVKYKIYWVALNDKTGSGQGDDPYGTDTTLTQTVNIGTSAVPYTPTVSITSIVRPNNYQEVYIGDYTNTSYGFLLAQPLKLPDGRNFTINPATRKIRLQAPATSTTGIPNNLTLDYLKFVPVL